MKNKRWKSACLSGGFHGSVRVRLSHVGTPDAQAELLGLGPACVP
jgi:hypothetical protein